MKATDQAIRDQALDTEQSFAISAPAGSGKTGLLIRRTLRLLTRCQEPEQVLAITFTRKAAAEMRQRLVAALDAANTHPPPNDPYQLSIWTDAKAVLDQDRARGWQLLANPSRLRIMTIDSLSRYLARQLALETGFGELPEPANQPEPLYREAVGELLAELERPGPEADALALLLGHLDNNLANLETLLVSLLAQREQWLGPLLSSRGARSELEATLQQVVADCLQSTQDLLQPYASELTMLADYAAANLQKNGVQSPLAELAGIAGLPAPSPTPSAIGQWQAIVHMLLTKDGDWRKPTGVNKKLGFPTKKDSTQPDRAEEYKARLATLLEWCAEQPGLLAQLTDLCHLPALTYSDEQWRLMEALAHLLPRLAALLSLVFTARHSCDFSEITLAALKALGDDDDPGQLAMRLDYRIQHILVDEFQDTSSLQYSLLKKLVAGWQPGDGRTLFIVGDGMQSLYGFRNANVGLFLEARRAPLNQVSMIPLDLETNFRSSPAIVDWVNHTFSQIFPARQDISRGAVPYALALAAKSDSADCGVTLDIFSSPSSPEDEARAVVERVLAARQSDPKGSIAILTRARGHLEAILPALHRAGIPWLATEIDPLAGRMPVMDLLSLTRALLNPADRIAWLSVLRAPWCGLDLQDLHRLANPHETIGGPYPWLPQQLWSEERLSSLSPSGRERLGRIAPILRAAWQQRHCKPLRQWIEGVWLALGGPATLIDTTEITWCEQYLNLLEEHELGGAIGDWNSFRQAIDRLYAAPGSDRDDPVHIMTIHKAKGLEFDTVVLPGLHRRGANGDSALLYWRERLGNDGESHLSIAPPLSPQELSQGGETSLLVGHLKYEAKLKSQLEDARVLYVGCTRAIKRLHLLFCEPDKGPTSGSLLASLWPAFANDTSFGNAAVKRHDPSEPATQGANNNGEAPSPPLTGLLRLQTDWQNPAAATSKSNSPTASGANLATHQHGADNRHLGTVLHRTLKQVAMDGTDRWNAERIALQRQAWLVQLRSLGVVDATSLLPVLERALCNVLADTAGRWLLEHHPSYDGAELSIGHKNHQGLPVVSVIDRLFIDDGILWIIDYKSSQPAEDQPLESFLTGEIERHRPQLERYRTALSYRHPGEIKTALYFPLIPHLVRID